MRIYPDKLAQALKTRTHPVYWVAGDEPLLVQEACDTLREHARAQGYTERKVIHADRKEHWQEAMAEANTLSLFAERQFIDIRCTSGSLGNSALLDYLQQPNPDTLILIRTNRPDSSYKKTQWFKLLDQTAAYLLLYPLEARQFPSWLAERARRQGIQLESRGLQLLADHTEGNLLAAVQEIDKLALQFGQATITEEQLRASIGDSAHFEVFSLNDALLEGNAAQALRILHTLQQEGENPLAITGALMRDLRTLANAAEDLAKGAALSAALKLPDWDKRQSLFGKALKRLRPEHTRRLIQQLALIDQSVKGMGQRPAWEELETLCLAACLPNAA